MTFFFKQQHAVWNLGCTMVVLCTGKDLFSPAAAANSRGSGATTPLILCSWPPIKPRPNQLQHNSSFLVLNPQNLMWAFLEGHDGCWTFTQAADLSVLHKCLQHHLNTGDSMTPVVLLERTLCLTFLAGPDPALPPITARQKPFP